MVDRQGEVPAPNGANASLEMADFPVRRFQELRGTNAVGESIALRIVITVAGRQAKTGHSGIPRRSDP
ncbi:hypothetical protein ACFVH7_31045 [Kitasatospora indigofera]|uniref:hypothetical protein n=1 Tax=Kitasatospora indigofera TaxID=67307 RepID=UPI003633C083